jgi:hypothetical protein
VAREATIGQQGLDAVDVTLRVDDDGVCPSWTT